MTRTAATMFLLHYFVARIFFFLVDRARAKTNCLCALLSCLVFGMFGSSAGLGPHRAGIPASLSGHKALYSLALPGFLFRRQNLFLTILLEFFDGCLRQSYLDHRAMCLSGTRRNSEFKSYRLCSNPSASVLLSHVSLFMINLLFVSVVLVFCFF